MRTVLLVALLAFVQLASAWTAGMVTPRAHVRHVGWPIVQMMDAEEPAPEPEPAPAPATPAAAEAGAAPPPAAEKTDYTTSGMASPVGLAAIAAIGLASYFGVFPN